jgi:hypothetical protein
MIVRLRNVSAGLPLLPWFQPAARAEEPRAGIALAASPQGILHTVWEEGGGAGGESSFVRTVPVNR